MNNITRRLLFILPLFAFQSSLMAGVQTYNPTNSGLDVTPKTMTTTTATVTGSLSVVGNITFSSNSIVDAYTSSFGAITAGSTSTLTWTEVTDRLSEFVTSSFTAKTAGYYHVNVDAGASQTAGTGCLLLKVNNVTIAGGDACIAGVTALLGVFDLSMNRTLSLSANDIVRIDGSATTANVTFQKMHLSIIRVS